MTTPSYINKAEYTWNGTSQVVTYPTVQDGDVGVLLWYTRATTVTWPTNWIYLGWTPQPFAEFDANYKTDFSTSSADLYVRARRLLATDSAGTFTLTSVSAYNIACLLIYRNVTGVQISGFPLTPGTSMTSHSASVLADGLALHVAAAYRSAGLAVLASTTGTQRSDQNVGSQIEMEVREDATTPPAVLTTTWTATNTADEVQSVAITLAGVEAADTVDETSLDGSIPVTGATDVWVYKGRDSKDDDTTGAA